MCHLRAVFRSPASRTRILLAALFAQAAVRCSGLECRRTLSSRYGTVSWDSYHPPDWQTVGQGNAQNYVYSAFRWQSTLRSNAVFLHVPSMPSGVTHATLKFRTHYTYPRPGVNGWGLQTCNPGLVIRVVHADYEQGVGGGFRRVDYYEPSISQNTGTLSWNGFFELDITSLVLDALAAKHDRGGSLTLVIESFDEPNDCLVYMYATASGSTWRPQLIVEWTSDESCIPPQQKELCDNTDSTVACSCLDDDMSQGLDVSDRPGQGVHINCSSTDGQTETTSSTGDFFIVEANDLERARSACNARGGKLAHISNWAENLAATAACEGTPCFVEMPLGQSEFQNWLGGHPMQEHSAAALWTSEGFWSSVNASARSGLSFSAPEAAATACSRGTDADDCRFPGLCHLCQSGQYLSNGDCVPCPHGLTSLVGSTDIAQCQVEVCTSDDVAGSACTCAQGWNLTGSEPECLDIDECVLQTHTCGSFDSNDCLSGLVQQYEFHPEAPYSDSRGSNHLTLSRHSETSSPLASSYMFKRLGCQYTFASCMMAQNQYFHPNNDPTSLDIPLGGLEPTDGITVSWWVQIWIQIEDHDILCLRNGTVKDPLSEHACLWKMRVNWHRTSDSVSLLPSGTFFSAEAGEYFQANPRVWRRYSLVVSARGFASFYLEGAKLGHTLPIPWDADLYDAPNFLALKVNGGVADVRIFRRALTAEELLTDRSYRKCEPALLCTGWATFARPAVTGLMGEQFSCLNTEGSFMCACPDGYERSADGRSCVDVDECETGAHNCNADQTIPAFCVNTPGDFSCECPVGSTKRGTTCVNVNECSARNEFLHNCHAFAQCTDTDGSYTCACLAGWGGDGIECRRYTRLVMANIEPTAGFTLLGNWFRNEELEEEPTVPIFLPPYEIKSRTDVIDRRSVFQFDHLPYGIHEAVLELPPLDRLDPNFCGTTTIRFNALHADLSEQLSLVRTLEEVRPEIVAYQWLPWADRAPSTYNKNNVIDLSDFVSQAAPHGGRLSLSMLRNTPSELPCWDRYWTPRLHVAYQNNRPPEISPTVVLDAAEDGTHIDGGVQDAEETLVADAAQFSAVVLRFEGVPARVSKATLSLTKIFGAHADKCTNWYNLKSKNSSQLEWISNEDAASNSAVYVLPRTRDVHLDVTAAVQAAIPDGGNVAFMITARWWNNETCVSHFRSSEYLSDEFYEQTNVHSSSRPQLEVSFEASVSQSGTRVWTRDGCSTSGTTHELQATALSTWHHVRCCATGDAGNTCRSYPAGSSVPYTSADGAGVTFAEAEALCEADGQRLCTVDELESGICCSTGAGHDSSRLWTSQHISTLAWTADGCAPTGEFHEDLLMDPSALNHVRCCTMDGSQCGSESSSGNLYSVRSGGGVTLETAESLCEADGKRLCTLPEMNSNMCCATGGLHDNSRVWTQPFQLQDEIRVGFFEVTPGSVLVRNGQCDGCWPRLGFRRSAISGIGPTALHTLFDVEILDLAGNNIASIEPDTFRDLTSLRELDLSDNVLEDLAPGTFDSMQQLEKLWLQRNRLAELRENVFAGLSRLHTLSLSENLLAHLALGSLNGLRALRWLDLSSNKLVSLDFSLWDPTPELAALSLGRNTLLSCIPQLPATIKWMDTKVIIETDVHFLFRPLCLPYGCEGDVSDIWGLSDAEALVLQRAVFTLLPVVRRDVRVSLDNMLLDREMYKPRGGSRRCACSGVPMCFDVGSLYDNTCGDGVLEWPEACDDGNQIAGDGCTGCVVDVCGDGVVNNNNTEECDDGNRNSRDGCSSLCRVEAEYCGDGHVNHAEEQCDDGNWQAGDGCDATCQTEFCGDGNVNNNNTEECDDGNMIDEDTCTSNCTRNTCGDGLPGGPGEECDDGSQNLANARCSKDCKCANGWKHVDGRCEDVDECSSLNVDCGQGGTCNNLQGNYTCACSDGWKLSIDGKQCEDRDECADSTADCDVRASCTNEIGGFSCSCPSGWLNLNEGRTCVQPPTDVVQCSNCSCSESESGVCHALAFCHGSTNVVGFPGGDEVVAADVTLPSDSSGRFLCTCSGELLGHGYGPAGCATKGYVVRVVYVNSSALSTEEEDNLFLLLGNITCQRGAIARCDHVHYTAHGTDLGVNVLFPHSEAAKLAADAAAAAFNAALRQPDLGRRSGQPPSQVSPDLGARVYAWDAESASGLVTVPPSGMELLSVHFEHGCESTGCWVLNVVYTTGSSDVRLETFNSFYLPYAVGSDALSYDYDYSDHGILETFEPANFPCRVVDYVGSDGAVSSLPVPATGCCFGTAFDNTSTLGGDGNGRGLLGNYRVTSAFASYASAVYPTLCPGGYDSPNIDDNFGSSTTPKPEDLFPDGEKAGPHHAQQFLSGQFVGMSQSPGVTRTLSMDPFVGQFQATIKLDERELRTKAGILRGTVGVEHTVDLFLGFVNFKPAATTWILDSLASQVAVHVEKTSFFSVATHGTNDYTFLEYVNLRLVAVYHEDADFSGSSESADRFVRTNRTGAAHYLQVTFTLADKYGVNANEGLVPLESVRAGRGRFFDEVDAAGGLHHKCREYTAEPANAFTRAAITRFNRTLSQPCAPAAAMCVSPDAIPDSFVAFNIPLGVDFVGDSSGSLDNSVFIDLAISAVDKDARAGTGSQSQSTNPNAGEAPWQVKTRLTGSVPVVAGGMSVFCDGVTAKTDLLDVADVDIIVGSASSLGELSRLRVIENAASSQLRARGEIVVDSDSIEAGLMTMVLKGNASFFASGSVSSRQVSLELEDVITVHLMESDGVAADGTGSQGTQQHVRDLLGEAPDDNSFASGLDTDGYHLNGAFYFTIDRSAQRAHLEPSPRLLELCPLNPPRPVNTGNVVLETCVTRRDVRFRDFPWRDGAMSTAMELSPWDAQSVLPNSGVEARFFTTILGDSVYARELAASFAGVIGAKYKLDGRFRRAFWLNPGYEWAPTQSGGAPLFQLSQKVFLFALVTLDEHIATDAGASVFDAAAPPPSEDSFGDGAVSPNLPRVPSARRRVLLQSVDPQAGTALSSAELSSSSSRSSLLSTALEVPPQRLARLRVGMALLQADACRAAAELQPSLRSALHSHLSRAATALQTVHILSLSVDPGSVRCGDATAARRQRSLLSLAAAAVVEVAVVFEADAQPELDLDELAQLPGVISLSLLSAPSGVQVHPVSADRQTPPGTLPLSDADGSASLGSNAALTAGVGAGVGVLVVALAAIVYRFVSHKSSAGAARLGSRASSDSAVVELAQQLKAEVAYDNVNSEALERAAARKAVDIVI